MDISKLVKQFPEVLNGNRERESASEAMQNNSNLNVAAANAAAAAAVASAQTSSSSNTSPGTSAGSMANGNLGNGLNNTGLNSGLSSGLGNSSLNNSGLNDSATATDVANLMNILNMTQNMAGTLPFKIDRPVYSTPPPCESSLSNNECHMTTLHGHKVAAFNITGDEYSAFKFGNREVFAK